MKLTKAQYKRYALELELENEGSFYRKYLRTTTCGERRSLIRNAITERMGHYNGTDIEDGEQLRRYFDGKWHLAADEAGVEKYAYLPDIWADDSTPQPKPKEPKPKEAKPVANAFHSTPTKDITMNKTTPFEITTKTLVNGTDVSTMADSEIYALIAGEELRIRELEAIQNKPKRLTAEIEKRQAGIRALVDYLDSKE